MAKTNSQTKPAYIALGSNLGDRDTLIKQALKQLADTPGVSVIAASNIIETTQLGKTNQPDFLNAAAKIETTLSPDNLLKESGRGIFIVRTLMDDVDFECTKNGSKVILIKNI